MGSIITLFCRSHLTVTDSYKNCSNMDVTQLNEWFNITLILCRDALFEFPALTSCHTANNHDIFYVLKTSPTLHLISCLLHEFIHLCFIQCSPIKPIIRYTYPWRSSSNPTYQPPRPNPNPPFLLPLSLVYTH